MAVDDLDTIDFVSVDPASGDVVLTISDHLKWDSSETHQKLLESKFNAFLRFVESGEMLKRIPRTAGSSVFDLRFLHRPDDHGTESLERARKFLHEAGFRLTY